MSNQENQNMEIESLSDDDLESVSGGSDAAFQIIKNTGSGTCTTSGSGTCENSGSGTCN
jgi:hypothetical protein